MDRGAWQATVRGVTKSWARLRDFHFNMIDVDRILVPAQNLP